MIKRLEPHGIGIHTIHTEKYKLIGQIHVHQYIGYVANVQNVFQIRQGYSLTSQDAGLRFNNPDLLGGQEQRPRAELETYSAFLKKR
jgi:hypothetical protein